MSSLHFDTPSIRRDIYTDYILCSIDCKYYLSLIYTQNLVILTYMSILDKQEEQTLIRLRQIREKAQISQLELSQRSGVSQNMITYIETGKRTPTLRTLLKLCKALNVNPAVLFLDDEHDRAKIKQEILDLIARYF